jgi:hypothetical protein
VKEKMLQQIRNGGVKERGEIFFLYIFNNAFGCYSASLYALGSIIATQ